MSLNLPEGFNKPIKGWERAARKGNRRGNQHYRWAKKQNRKNWDVAKPIIENLTTMMNDQMANATTDRQRYEDVFVPYEDQVMTGIEGLQGKVDTFSSEVAKLKQEAEEYGSEANKGFMMGRAQAGVGQAFEAARNNNLEIIESHGINPGASRYRAMDAGVRMAEAAAKAAAGTQAGLNVDETSRAMFQEALDREVQARGLDTTVMGLRKGMVDVGRTYPELALREQIGAGASGEGAIRGQVSVSDLANKQRATTNDFMRTLNESLRGWSDAIKSGYDVSLAEQKAEAESSSGIGGLIGTVLPFAQKALPLFAQEGGEIPQEASVSGGAIADDVPVMASPGEFMFPVEAVQFYGTQKLQSMVDKANTAGAGADASTEPAIPEDTMTAFNPMQPMPMAPAGGPRLI